MAPTKITEKEANVLALAWQCFKSTPEIDIDKLARLAGYANPRSVSNLLSSIKKKMSTIDIDGQVAGDGENAFATPAKPARKKPATPGSRKRKGGAGADNTDGDGAEDLDETPVKRATRGKKAAPIKQSIEDDDDEEQKKATDDAEMEA